MPMPGSQELDFLDLAYFLHLHRWAFRILLAALLFYSIGSVFKYSKILPIISIFILVFVYWQFNFKMTAESMFLQPSDLIFEQKGLNKIEEERLILGIHAKGISKAYPIQLIGYHHQVRDTLGGMDIMITYCTVCRTGRAYEPVVNGRKTQFRLVGMDHFNALFEDMETKSWWRQATGEAVVGEMEGQKLPEVSTFQMSLRKWLEVHPESWIMQPDPQFQVKYDSMSTYEYGKYYGTLTRKDSLSWRKKSWVVGIEVDGKGKAYDWNRLQKERVVYDMLSEKPIVILLADDHTSFIAFERNSEHQKFELRKDTLISGEQLYNFLGKSLNGDTTPLKQIAAYQEYFHSWLKFHPKSELDTL